MKKKLTFKRFITGLSSRGYLNSLSDKNYCKLMFRATMNKKLNLKNPQTYNEKLQWLKLYNRKTEYTMMVDKYSVREYIANKIGEEYLIPLIGAWDNPDDIDFNSLGSRFVLKCNHNSGLGMCICKDITKLDTEKAREELKKGINQNYFLSGREWPYKDVKRKIIAEEFIEDKVNGDLCDYKFFCFNGTPDNVMVCSDRASGTTKFYFFDMNWKLLRYNGWGMKAAPDFTLQKPENFEEMKRIASVLSADIPACRIDLYNVEGKIYFGEITFFPTSGFDCNLTKEADEIMGKKITII